MSTPSPLRVCVTGAAGQIAYSLLYSIANGDVFGSDQPITLLLLDIAPMMEVLNGVVMELQDCSLPLLNGAIASSDPMEAFSDIDVAVLVGAMPRREGMERKDLLKANAKIFQAQGKALNQVAKKTVKVLVVGNPANTNCLITQTCAPSIPKENFTCLTRLDQNRARAQIAMRLACKPDDVKKVVIWGNHSSTQYADVNHGTVNGTTVKEAVKDDNWIQGDFLKTVQTRGAAIIKARKLSSAMSAAKAICDHLRTWWYGTEEGDYASMGVVSGGEYGIEKGIVYSYPLQIAADHTFKIVEGLTIDDFSRGKMDATAKELIEERDTALAFINQSE